MANVAESQVGCSLKVGETDVQIHSVGRERQGIGDVLKVVNIYGCQIVVVVDVHAANSCQFNSGKGVELSVGNDNVVGSRDTLVEVETLKRRQSDPADVVDSRQRVKLES